MTIQNKQTDVTTRKDKPVFEFGLYTFGDTVPNLHGVQVSHKQRLKEIVDAAKLADQAGLDIFGIGEHHTLDFAVSSNAVVLAAIAQATERIRLTSATTVLSTVDPVRLFEDFATLDLLSEGRAEIIAGRGAFVDSFPLFGYKLDDYSQLFSEKLDLLMKLRESDRITWSGQYRSAINDLEIAPRPDQRDLPLWVGVGGTPQSAVNAGRLGLGMALAILGGSPERAKPLVDLYRQSGLEAGHDSSKLQVAVTSHGYVAETSQQAKDEFYPHYSNYMGHFLGKRAGGTAAISRSDFEMMVGPGMAIPVGSPQEVAEKILRQYELFGHSRYILQLDIGNMPYAKVAKAIELLADKVAPIVRREISKQKQG
ncbi:LLM class flavin-dependent oxidoreductase [Paenibacillus glycanilyticus]|uniref:LLM class flavin-dependent oxidoreductase n=1 Tax=Paenibacillus glycanilyticus TaxID=126569 RepID=UPI00203B1C9C|nr:LLM class flavin-dependent oxidoreductase [Paenibacillus glycanilyticus]MCM3627053.1 LLM class flavin-dependent oxidoreductase [Paenibacillus glycanilyticus]